MSRIYLDHCASTPLHPEARRAMIAWLEQERCGHASSVHGHGREAEAVVSRARTQVANLIGARASEIVFTGSGTEACNLAVKGAAGALRAAGKGNHIITTEIEHEAVLEPCRELSRQGFRVTRLPVGPDGRVDLEAYERALTPDTVLVAVGLVNHEVGTVLPVAELATLARARGVMIFSDAAMAVGRVGFSIEALGVDLLGLSGHKFGGPQGVGALYVRRGVKLEAQIHGGVHERKRRAGAENVLGILGMGVAASRVKPEEDGARLARLTDRLRCGVLEQIDDIQLNGHPNAAPGILNLSFEGIEGEAVLMNLDLVGISVSSGAPCSSGSLEPSPVLLALGLSEARARASVRFSLGVGTTGEEIERVLETLPGVIGRLRELTKPRGVGGSVSRA